eukprot:TRINITY_DN9299_c0_g1_i1.p1 TRINITY_DN9299_c0_g1~~TRINITY_DN9299_c0_g1_i1.p1  ORF type:complete len:233 (-),score=8.86 TRINITY_DN9299_c0_g1_i1:520-1218(-)
MAARFVALLLLASLSFAAADGSRLAAQLNAAGCSGFVKLMEQADLLDEIQAKVDNGEVTMFVPSDDALMYKLSPALLAYLKAPVNKDILRKVLLFHVLTERISAFKWDGAHPTLEGSAANLRMDALAFYVSNVAVKQYNAVINQDAVVHTIRGLMIPSSLESVLGSVDFASVVLEDEEDGRRILAGTPTVAPTAPPSTPPSPPPPKASAPMLASGLRWIASVAALFAVALLW